MPIDANVPMTVAITDDTVAIRKVLPTALQRSGDLGDLNMAMYASKLKPLSKLKFELFENEYIISRIMGAYRMASITAR